MVSRLVTCLYDFVDLHGPPSRPKITQQPFGDYSSRLYIYIFTKTDDGHPIMSNKTLANTFEQYQPKFEKHSKSKIPCYLKTPKAVVTESLSFYDQTNLGNYRQIIWESPGKHISEDKAESCQIFDQKMQPAKTRVL